MAKFPLKIVTFKRLTSLPGCSVMMITAVPMEARLADGSHYTCPQPFFNEETQRVEIGDREYPLSRVHFFERARAAKSVPQEVDYDQYTIGKREPRRIKISVESREDLGPVFKKTPRD